MLLHILLFDRAYSVTYWLNYSELRARLRRRFHTVETPLAEFRTEAAGQTSLGLRLHTHAALIQQTRGQLLQQYAPQVASRSVAAFGVEHAPTLAPNTAWGAGVALWAGFVRFSTFTVQQLCRVGRGFSSLGYTAESLHPVAQRPGEGSRV